jgi:ADP-ribosyl-[dinitrogen reductase] hydrolase
MAAVAARRLQAAAAALERIEIRVNEPERFRGCLLGLAAGDAVGAAIEFLPRGMFAPLTDMLGGGPFALRPGEWTDDTSMALCLGASLVECGGFDARDQMARYSRWVTEGEWSSTGHCFDVGATISDALARFQYRGDPYAGSTDPQTAGNGSLVRVAPVSMFYHPDERGAAEYGASSSRTTHGAAECVDSCRLFASMLCRALSGHTKLEILFGETGLFRGAPRVEAIARGEYRGKLESGIYGTGYVIDCLEAALWCFERTSSFEEAVLRAANLGDDADTTAAVCGQLAGAFYGESAIPEHWRSRLARADEIVALADALRAAPKA